MGRWNAVISMLWVGSFCVLLTGCGSSAEPKMEWGGEGFFSFPWPNDLRKNADGTVDLAGFPGTGNPLLKTVLDKGIPYMHGFGINSAVIFQFNRELDSDSFPDAKQTLAQDSAVMLVNIDPSHPSYLQRIPVRLNFDPITTLYQPGQLLTLLPVPGYSLDPETDYAAIVFSGLLDLSGEPIKTSKLVLDLRAGARPTNLDEAIWQPLNLQWEAVARYTADNTAWSTDQIAAFTVYRTMNPTQYAFPVARAVDNLSDEAILDSVHIVQAGPMCGYYNHLPVEASIELPVWQAGKKPYTLSGGMVEIDEVSGLAVQQGVEVTGMSIHIGCSGDGAPKTPVIYADGTGGSFYSAGAVTGGVYDGDLFDQVVLSVAPHQSGERADPVLTEYVDFLQSFGVSVQKTDLEGITFYNLLNPAANIGNHIQSAADQLYLRRVAVLLPQILERDGVYQEPLSYDFSTFHVRSDSAMISGHSQGASIVPLAMAMDARFTTGYLNGAASHAYFQAVHRGSIRDLIPILLPGFVQSEVDYFHPLMQVLQMMHGPADSVSYVPYMQPTNLLQTAGYQDGCVPREASAALGLALARAGLMQPATPYSNEASFFDPDGILDMAKVFLPLNEGNLDNGGVGLFLELGSGHSFYTRGSRISVREFFQRSLGSIPDQPIQAPRFDQGGTGCDVRYEQGYSLSE